MIAEQDFVLRIRRINRLQLPQTVYGITRNLNDYNETDRDDIERKIRDYCAGFKGEIHAMANGDLFAVFPALHNADAEKLRASLLALAYPDGPIAEPEKGITLYQLPKDYEALRARANSYVELARASEVMGPMQQAVRALQAADMRGPLTAASLAQVEKLLDHIDIKRYVRTQPVYRQDSAGHWEKAWIDFYISIGDLKKERFPRLNLETPERLFLEMCYTLDRRLLLELAGQGDAWADKSISINLSAETVLSPAFAQFCHVLPNDRRGQVIFDIHRSDLFLNFTTTRNAMNVLKQEGFRVGIDGITPTVLPYIHFALLPADYFKINAGRDKWAEFKEKAVQDALRELPVDKVVFSHCDHDEALRAGTALGVRHHQGWLIDDVATALPG